MRGPCPFFVPVDENSDPMVLPVLHGGPVPTTRLRRKVRHSVVIRKALAALEQIVDFGHLLVGKQLRESIVASGEFPAGAIDATIHDSGWACLHP